MLRVAGAACAVLTAFLLGGCSVHGKVTPLVSQSDLQAQIATQLEKATGEKPANVSCPAPLEGVVGQTQRCSLVSAAGNTFGLTVTVTSVSGTTVNFDIKVDAAPTGSASGSANPSSTASALPSVPGSDLEDQVSSQLERTVGQKPSSVSCPDPLQGSVGQSARCTLTATDGTVYGLTVTVTSVSSATVQFSIEVDPTPSTTS
ncbi:MAG TPA: DUF4333 domain-containing protein [Pedococcus sp.]|nr:DUF4333 domain-containing protein [Pedococcus sp.]